MMTMDQLVELAGLDPKLFTVIGTDHELKPPKKDKDWKKRQKDMQKALKKGSVGRMFVGTLRVGLKKQ